MTASNQLKFPEKERRLFDIIVNILTVVEMAFVIKITDKVLLGKEPKCN